MFWQRKGSGLNALQRSRALVAKLNEDSENSTKIEIQWDPGIENPTLKPSIKVKNDKNLAMVKKLKIEMMNEIISDNCSLKHRPKMDLSNRTCAGCLPRSQIDGPLRDVFNFVQNPGNVQVRNNAMQNIELWGYRFTSATGCKDCLEALSDIIVVLLNAM